MKLPVVKVDTMKSLLDCALDGLGEIAVHEADAFDRHLDALRARAAVARRARRVGELLRDQFDLIPDTQSRFAADHRKRVALWRDVGQRLRRAAA